MKPFLNRHERVHGALGDFSLLSIILFPGVVPIFDMVERNVIIYLDKIEYNFLRCPRDRVEFPTGGESPRALYRVDPVEFRSRR